MSNIKGIFSDQDSYVLSQQSIAAASRVKGDLNVILIENDQVHSTNVFLATQALTNTPAAPASAVTLVGSQTVGAGISGGSILPNGNPNPRRGGNGRGGEEQELQ